LKKEFSNSGHARKGKRPKKSYVPLLFGGNSFWGQREKGVASSKDVQGDAFFKKGRFKNGTQGVLSERAQNREHIRPAIETPAFCKEEGNNS